MDEQGDYNPAKPVERVQEALRPEPKAELPERQVSVRWGSQTGTQRGMSAKEAHEWAVKANALRERSVSPQSSNVRDPCPHQWQTSFVKAMGREKRVCGVCGEQEFL